MSLVTVSQNCRVAIDSNATSIFFGEGKIMCLYNPSENSLSHW